jgi:glutaconate CoA-transferase subunit B
MARAKPALGNGSMTADYSSSELLAVMGARALRDDTTIFAGVGVPLLAAALAQQRHAPRLTMVIEGGIIGPRIRSGRLPISTNEMRAGHRATMLPGITDTFLFAQRGFLDVGFMGGAQIDRHGNINTSAIGGDYWHPKVRLPGTGGANDIASLCREVIILTAHERRRFVERVDFVTSPAWLEGDGARRGAGLLFGGVSQVITTLGIFGFDPATRQMRIDATHPGVAVDTIRASTGFSLLEASTIAVTEPPAADELAMLRALDPDRRFLG